MSWQMKYINKKNIFFFFSTFRYLWKHLLKQVTLINLTSSYLVILHLQKSSSCSSYIYDMQNE